MNLQRRSTVMLPIGNMLEASQLSGLFLGFAVGIFLDIVWRRTGLSKYEGRVEMLEHYHWGFTLLILARLLKNLGVTFAGIGLYLIFAEFTQRHPFAIGSSHEYLSTLIGAILAVPLVLTYVTL
jgi:hypothetical protein